MLWFLFFLYKNDEYEYLACLIKLGKKFIKFFYSKIIETISTVRGRLPIAFCCALEAF